MQGSLRVKRFGWALVVIALAPFFIGIGLEDSNSTVLNDDEYGNTGTFTITLEEEGMVIIAFDEYGTYECEDFFLEIYGEYGQPVSVTKTDCVAWGDRDMYQFKAGPLEPGKYEYEATDEVWLLAVEGELDSFMDNYALGETLSSLGCGMCCFGLLTVLAGRGVGMAHASTADNQVVLMGQHDSAQLTQVIQSPQSNMYDDIVKQAEAAAPIPDVVEEETGPGGFWGDIAQD